MEGTIKLGKGAVGYVDRVVQITQTGEMKEMLSWGGRGHERIPEAARSGVGHDFFSLIWWVQEMCRGEIAFEYGECVEVIRAEERDEDNVRQQEQCSGGG